VCDNDIEGSAYSCYDCGWDICQNCFDEEDNEEDDEDQDEEDDEDEVSELDCDLDEDDTDDDSLDPEQEHPVFFRYEDACRSSLTFGEDEVKKATRKFRVSESELRSQIYDYIGCELLQWKRKKACVGHCGIERNSISSKWESYETYCNYKAYSSIVHGIRYN
jgi:hypothetical protein